MITADEALKIGLVNKVVSLDTKSDVLTGSSEERIRKLSNHKEEEDEDEPKLLNSFC